MPAGSGPLGNNAGDAEGGFDGDAGGVALGGLVVGVGAAVPEVATPLATPWPVAHAAMANTTTTAANKCFIWRLRASGQWG